MGKCVGITIDLDWPLKYHHLPVAGVMRYARKHTDWRCEVDAYPEDRDDPRRYDGIIARAEASLGRHCRRYDIPLVNIWGSSPIRDVPSVLLDTERCGRLAARHLMNRGFKRFGCLLPGKRSQPTGHEQGFLEAIGDLPCSTEHLDAVTNDRRSWRSMQSTLPPWLAGLTPPVGIYAPHDIHGRCVANVCLQAGLRIPDDIAVITAENDDVICGALEPTLSSIRSDPERVGYRAAQMLDEIMRGAPTATDVRLPPVGLIARRSTEVFAVEDRLVADALRRIWDSSHQSIGVDHICEGLPIGRRSLEQRFRKALGRTIHEEITRAHLQLAKRLLGETDLSIGEIAIRSGFNGPNHLGKVFRRIERVTPRGFRESAGPRG